MKMKRYWKKFKQSGKNKSLMGLDNHKRGRSRKHQHDDALERRAEHEMCCGW